MKTRNNELEEMIDLVIKLIWTHTIFRTLFRKQDADSEVRGAHPEFFLAIHDSLICSFCVGVEILFQQKAKARSLWSLVRQVEPLLSNKLTASIQAHNTSIQDIEAIRHQVCAHRWQAKSPQKVFAEAQLRIKPMTEMVDLVRFLILELAGEVESKRRAGLEQQQMNESTLSCVAGDAERVLDSFRIGVGRVPGRLWGD
ncbi:MAG TPA: hypothetical protein VFE51_11830 [Verrucomicrobiae bacterium]|nr:hypothetical protein [Verrucomicrobiae bacterium]